MLISLRSAIAFSLATGSVVAAAQEAPRGYFAESAPARARLERFVREQPSAARIRGYIREMTRFPHVAGTPGSKRVAEWAAQQFRSWGLDTRVEQYEALIPRPIEQVLESAARDPGARACARRCLRRIRTRGIPTSCRPTRRTAPTVT